MKIPLWKKFHRNVKERLGLIVSTLIVSISFTGCLCTPKEANSTPPDVPLHGWSDETVASSETGEVYEYLHLPSEDPDAPPLILIHGFSINKRMFLHCTPLAAEFETYSLELPHTSSLYSGRMSDYRRILVDFADSLGLDRFLLGGVSFGGGVSFDFFHYEERDRVMGLVLISTSVPNGTPMLRWRNRVTFRLLNGLGDRQILCIIERTAEDEVEETTEHSSDNPGDRNVMGIWYLKPVEYYRQVLQAVRHMPSMHPGAKISCPTLVLHGDSDGTVPLELAELTVTLVDDARLIFYEAYDHDMAYRHGEAIADDIVRWWRSIDTEEN